MDRLQTMTAFVSVAEAAGFAPAARRLGMSPPAVTRAVSELEARLGCRLLHRTTRSVRVDRGGASLSRRLPAHSLTEIEEADRHAAGIHAAPRGLVSVTASVHVRPHGPWCRPCSICWIAIPEISVTTLFVDRVVHLVDEGIDVAVRIAELPDSSLRAIRVGAVRRVSCARRRTISTRTRAPVYAPVRAIGSTTSSTSST